MLFVKSARIDIRFSLTVNAVRIVIRHQVTAVNVNESRYWLRYL